MTSGAISKPRRVLARAGYTLGGVVVVAMVGFGLMFWIGGNDVNNFCQEARPGLPVSELAALAAKYHVRLRPGLREVSGARTLQAHSPRSYGRHTCAVRIDGKMVIDRQVNYAG